MGGDKGAGGCPWGGRHGRPSGHRWCANSAGAYAPGQEKAPNALRAAGLMELLSTHGIPVDDRGDVPGFRWRPDRANVGGGDGLGKTVRVVARPSGRRRAELRGHAARGERTRPDSGRIGVPGPSRPEES